MNDEYSMLREEIMLCMKTIKNNNNVLYTATVALLALAFSYSQGFIFLLPFVVIIPLYFLTKREMIQAMRIGAYIFVFLENEDSVQWETRLIMYDKYFKRNYHKHISLNTYLGISLLCVTLSIINTDYSNFNVYSIICLILQSLLAIFSVILFSFMSPDYAKLKNEYIEQWSIIKENEIANKIHLKIVSK